VQERREAACTLLGLADGVKLPASVEEALEHGFVRADISKCPTDLSVSYITEARSLFARVLLAICAHQELIVPLVRGEDGNLMDTTGDVSLTRWGGFRFASLEHAKTFKKHSCEWFVPEKMQKEGTRTWLACIVGALHGAGFNFGGAKWQEAFDVLADFVLVS